jgi:hypothetical protein
MSCTGQGMPLEAASLFDATWMHFPTTAAGDGLITVNDLMVL